MIYLIYLILQIREAFVRVPRINSLISHLLTDENKHIHHLH